MDQALSGSEDLQSSISFLKWPDLKTRIAAYVAFNHFSEKYTWKMMGILLNKNPRVAVKLMISNMTTLSADTVMASFTPEQIDQLVKLFKHSRSNKGFMNDIKSVSATRAKHLFRH